MLVHDLIRQGAENAPIFRGNPDISYGQLQSAVASYRSYFYSNGIRPEDNVGLIARNCPEFVYCYLAITSLGAVAVPMNFQLMPREIAFIVKDSNMKHLVAMDLLDLKLDLDYFEYDLEPHQLLIPQIIKAVSDDAYRLDTIPTVSIDENQPAAIIYTSGTTGNPKGAVLTHRNLVSNVHSFRAVFPIGSEDNALCVLPMYHSFAWTCAVLYTLLQGASMTILDAFAPKETIAAIREFNVTVFYGVPPMYNILARMALPEDLASIRHYVSGGAALPQKIAEQFRNKFGTAILEGYGLSEASPVVSLNPMNRVKYGSIGKPLPEVEVKVVNPRAEELPIGEIGELVVRGPNVMQGYYHLALETAHALRNGWLHTGDMAYQDAEGYFFIVDRLKDMIIVNGENVYPREVEEVLYTYPGIVETAVIGVPDDLRGEAVCAYVVLEEGKVLDKKDLRDFLVPRLAAYKIPRDFIRLDGLPKNKTGKIMKRTLREQVLSEFSQQQTG